MKREDFERLKEEEKEHLREIRKLKERLREAKRMRSIGEALHDVKAAGSTEDLEEALTQLELEVLESEARLEMALEADPEKLDSGIRDPEELEADLSKERAAELVRHMKISMGLEDAPGRAAEPGLTEGKRSVGRPAEAEASDADDPVDVDEADDERDSSKTIGRMKPRND